jgi:hypothetical protein
MAIIKSGATTDQWTIDPTSKAGRVTLYDSSGNAVKVETGYAGNKYLGVCMNQDVELSAGNSYTGSIANGATWNGTSDDAMNSSAIQYIIWSSKTVTIALWQGDGTNWDIEDTVVIPANFGVTRVVASVAPNFYISITNNSGGSANVRLTTAQTPVMPVLPRSLTEGGNLKVTVAASFQAQNRVKGYYALSSYRTAGTAASPQNIFTIENPAASLNNIAVRGLSVATDSTATLTTVAPMIKLSRATGLPTGGTALTAQKYETSSVAAGAICRGGTASDDGVATAITATAIAPALWVQSIDRLNTAVGWIQHPGYNLIPDVGTDLRQIILVPGEALLVQGVTAMAATTSILVNCSWIEYLAL